MKLFISYCSEADQAFADDLAHALREMGVEPAIINLKMMCGDSNPDRVERVIRDYDYVIPVFSEAYVRDPWLQNELLICLLHERAAKNKFILPVLIGNCDVPALLKQRTIDFRGAPFKEGFTQLAASMSASRKVFVIMKLKDARLDSAYDVVMRPVAEDFGYSVLRIDEQQDSGLITEQILRHIERSDIVIAELAGERPNCYYEAGYAHALGKELILTIHASSKVHFDLAGYRFIRWDTEKELKGGLAQRFTAIRERERVAMSRQETAASE